MSPELSTKGIFANTKSSEVIFVIVAMTEEEASILAKGKILDRTSVTQDDKDAFYKFHQVLVDEHNFVDFIKIFGNKRDDWKPDRESDRSIKDLIVTICGEISCHAPESDGVNINPCFLSSEFFEKENEDIRIGAWNRISKRGGIMIVDALSLYHPEIAYFFTQFFSKLGTDNDNKRVALLIHLPVNLINRNINKLITGFFSSDTSKYKFIYERFDKDCDRLCEIGVGDPCSLRRWLFSTMLALAPKEGMSPDNHEIMEEHVGPKYGMNTQVFSGRRR
jgi:hypothetical protein